MYQNRQQTKHYLHLIEKMYYKTLYCSKVTFYFAHTTHRSFHPSICRISEQYSSCNQWHNSTISITQPKISHPTKCQLYKRHPSRYNKNELRFSYFLLSSYHRPGGSLPSEPLLMNWQPRIGAIPQVYARNLHEMKNPKDMELLCSAISFFVPREGKHIWERQNLQVNENHFRSTDGYRARQSDARQEAQ